MYSFEVSKSKISASEPQKMMVLCRFETMTLLMRHPVSPILALIYKMNLHTFNHCMVKNDK